MKKKVTITAVVIICILLVVAVALSANRAGGEIGFEATIDSVENGVAYATINKQDAGFLAPKLPGNIEFNTSDLDVKLQAGDEISGCYLSGTINGSSVRVVDVTIKGNASQGINDLISLNEVSDYITEKGYTSKDFEESLMGRFREDIIRSWGASDLLFSGINADGWYLDDDKNRGISRDCPLVLRGMVRSALHSLARSAMSFCASAKFSGEMICKSGNTLDCVLPLRSTPVYMILCRM